VNSGGTKFNPGRVIILGLVILARRLLPRRKYHWRLSGRCWLWLATRPRSEVRGVGFGAKRGWPSGREVVNRRWSTGGDGASKGSQSHRTPAVQRGVAR